MSSFDLIICFDQAIFELHVWDTLSELGIKRGQWAKGNPWSKEIRELLNERQDIQNNDIDLNTEVEFLASGTTTCRGSAQGPADTLSSPV